MHFLSTTLTLVLLLRCQQAAKLIIDGKLASPGQFPYIALIQIVYFNSQPDDPLLYSSGTIISDRYLVGDAFSFVDVSWRIFTMEVTLGATNLLEPEPFATKVYVRDKAAITLHPKYDPKVNLYSIAIIRLPKRVQFNSFVQPVRLPRWRDVSNDFSGHKGVVIGYGKTQFLLPPEEIPEHLRYRELDMMSNDDCAAMIERETGAFEPELLCTVSAVGLFDNGCPLTVNHDGNTMLIGTLSHTLLRLNLTQPKAWLVNLFTRTTEFLEFIDQHSDVRIFQ